MPDHLKQTRRLPDIAKIQISNKLGQGVAHHVYRCEIHFKDRKVKPILAARSYSNATEFNDSCAKPVHTGCHPNILRRYFHRTENQDNPNQSGEKHCVYYEYCPLGDLSHFKLPTEYIPQAFLGLVDALNWMHHDLGIAHRDIWPENILMGSDGRLKFADPDFYTRSLERSSEANVRYRPCLHEDYHPHAHDAYSLGITLFAMYASNIYQNILWQHSISEILNEEKNLVAEALLKEINENKEFWQQHPLAAQVIQGLLQSDPTQRREFLKHLASHEYFKGLRQQPIDDVLFHSQGDKKQSSLLDLNRLSCEKLKDHDRVLTQLSTTELEITTREAYRAQSRELNLQGADGLFFDNKTLREHYREVGMRYHLPTAKTFLRWLNRELSEADSCLQSIVTILQAYHCNHSVNQRLAHLTKLYALVKSELADIKNENDKPLLNLLYRKIKKEMRLYDPGPWQRHYQRPRYVPASFLRSQAPELFPNFATYTEKLPPEQRLSLLLPALSVFQARATTSVDSEATFETLMFEVTEVCSLYKKQ